MLVLVLAGFSFAWAGRTGRALEPVPANPTATRASIQATTCATTPREVARIAPQSEATVAAQREWISDLPAGAPPLTPWWHDGVLHVGEVEIETPFPVSTEFIEVAGGSILIGDPAWDDESKEARWAIVRGGRPVLLPTTGKSNVSLSVDGRIAYWVETADSFGPETEPRRVVTWDVLTSQKLATRELDGTVLGVDSDGIAYVRDPGTVVEWDLRADVIEPSDLTWDDSKVMERAVLHAGRARRSGPSNTATSLPTARGRSSPDPRQGISHRSAVRPGSGWARSVHTSRSSPPTSSRCRYRRESHT